MPRTTTADLITHPLRARILIGLMGRELTTGEIAEMLPDVPRASLYRQVRRLLEGGVVEVVRETPVRGTLEKVYAVRRDAGQIPAEEAAEATAADHLRHFSSFVETMTEQYRAYLESADAAPPRDVTMVATPLWLDEAAHERFKQELRALIRSFEAAEPASGSRRRVLWIASIPDRPEKPGP